MVDGQAGRGHLALAPGAARRRATNPATSRCSRSGCAATGPRSCSTRAARCMPELAALAPAGDAADERQPARQRRPAAARPGPAGLPRLRRRRCRAPGGVDSEADAGAGRVRCATSCARNAGSRTSGSFGPDETASNRLDAVFEVTDRAWIAEHLPGRRRTSRRDGRVMEVLSEHLCQGWLEGYLLTGRHGLFSCYEAFIHIVDSMFNQHAKWLQGQRELSLAPTRSRRSTTCSPRTVWRQDHNGFTHQDPGFIDHRREQEGRIVRVYLPPDANTLLSVSPTTACAPGTTSTSSSPASSRAAVAVDGRSAIAHCARGTASGTGPATTRAASPTSCWPARATCRRWRRSPPSTCCASTCRSCRVRVVNVVDLMRLQPEPRASARPDRPRVRPLFTADKPVDLRLPRLSLADPPADLPPHEPRQPPRARLQGGGHDDDAVRHGRAERPRPLPPGRWTSSTGCPGWRRRPARPSVHGRQAAGGPAHTGRMGEDLPEIRDWTVEILVRMASGA